MPVIECLSLNRGDVLMGSVLIVFVCLGFYVYREFLS